MGMHIPVRLCLPGKVKMVEIRIIQMAITTANDISITLLTNDLSLNFDVIGHLITQNLVNIRMLNMTGDTVRETITMKEVNLHGRLFLHDISKPI